MEYNKLLVLFFLLIQHKSYSFYGWTLSFETTLNLLKKDFWPFQIIVPQQYSIHLMWINKQLTFDEKYIYPSNNTETLHTILTWARKNPEITINVWFDGSLTTSNAEAETISLINETIKNENIKSCEINLKDIRQLSEVKANPEIFSEKIPVYFRSDLLRAIIADEVTRKDKESIFVYADLDVKPMSKAELFDQKTLNTLNKYDFIMAHETNLIKFENSFQMFRYNKYLSEALKIMVIKANILKAKEFLTDIREKTQPGNFFYNAHKAWNIHEVGFQENVYYSYPLMFAYFCQLQNKGVLKMPGSSKPYNFEIDGEEILKRNAKILMCKSSSLEHLKKIPMPTKVVSIPRSNSAIQELNSNS